MSTFPPKALVVEGQACDCSYYSEIDPIDRDHDYLFDQFECQGFKFFYFKGIADTRIPTASRPEIVTVLAPLKIPAFFSHVKITKRPETDGEYCWDLVPMKKEYNGTFAMCINNRHYYKKKERDSDEDMLDAYGKRIPVQIMADGNANCGNPVAGMIPGGGEGAKSNISNLFFKFSNHYFTPLILSNGLTCYYAFENKEIMIHWIENLEASSNQLRVAIDMPIYSDNILGVLITKHARLVDCDFERKDWKFCDEVKDEGVIYFRIFV